jgi:hypothetical protein
VAQLIKPTEVSVKTVNGEVLLNIKLDININLTQSNIVPNVIPESKVENKIEEKKKEEPSLWEIPDFVSVPKIKFGSKEQS